jgi:predicted unusual protein kinase regulating ubiquinone biosynthesis (AarF/ABC1/UbiB family)
VHKARIKATGEEICLKIQYPGIKEAMKSDTKTIKSFLSTIQHFVGLDPSRQIDQMLDDFIAMLNQEMDYVSEAAKQKAYYEYFANDPNVIVPQIYERYTTPTILAMEYVEGVPVDDEKVLSLSRERRQRLGGLVFGCTSKQLFLLERFQADSHIGNYLVQIDDEAQQDKLVLLDFGATIKIPHDLKLDMLKAVNVAKLPEAEPLDMLRALKLDAAVTDEQSFQLLLDAVKRVHQQAHKNGHWLFTPGAEAELVDEIYRESRQLVVAKGLLKVGHISDQLPMVGHIPRNLPMIARGLHGVKRLFTLLEYQLDLEDAIESLAALGIGRAA